MGSSFQGLGFRDDDFVELSPSRRNVPLLVGARYIVYGTPVTSVVCNGN